MWWSAVTGAGVAAAWKIASWWLDESGRAEMKKRKVLREKKEECRQALLDGRLDDLRRLTDELQRLSTEA
jgi:hypothetical protein